MDFEESDKESEVSALHLETAILRLIKTYQETYRGAKRPGIINKGFYYFFLRNRHRLGYSLGSGTFNENSFEVIFKNTSKFTNLLKAWSAKLNRYFKETEYVIKKLEEDPEYIIERPTLINQLSVADFVVLTEGLSDKELLEILRGKDHIERMVESAKIEIEVHKKIYEIED
jgi:hypothetical protein